MANKEKRSSMSGYESLTRVSRSAGQRVGGRSGESAPCFGGGGYLDECTDPGFTVEAEIIAADPRLKELQEIGLSLRWIEVAHAIGFDAFITMWQVLDKRNLQDTLSSSSLKIKVPKFRRYLTHQRNRFINTLRLEGFHPKEIRKIIKMELKEDISERHIFRVSSDCFFNSVR